MTVNKDNLVWLDLEMTGLDLEKDCIIEIATVVTDSQLNTVAEGPSLAIHQSDEILNQMGEWCTKQHNASGLVERIQKSTINAQEAEKQTLDFLKAYVPPNISPLCGNSICQDRRFLYKEMPTLAEFFHYRNIDVSTLKILAQRWYPQIAAKVIKESRHLALNDVYDSIEELRFYREHLFDK
jgi:oligoribonuclease